METDYRRPFLFQIAMGNKIERIVETDRKVNIQHYGERKKLLFCTDVCLIICWLKDTLKLTDT